MDLSVVANDERVARLELARKLRERADHSSEQELRDALSRSYYSLYHAARVLIGREKGGLGHDKLREEVQTIDSELAATLKDLYRLRENADYNPEMVAQLYAGDMERFREGAEEALQRGSDAYRQIQALISAKQGE
jgi:uncharacterized protein (UPF0332 family)